MRDTADKSMAKAVFVCNVCGGDARPPNYWFRSNAAGDNLGGIYCSEAHARPTAETAANVSRPRCHAAGRRAPCRTSQDSQLEGKDT